MTILFKSNLALWTATAIAVNVLLLREILMLEIFKMRAVKVAQNLAIDEGYRVETISYGFRIKTRWQVVMGVNTNDPTGFVMSVVSLDGRESSIVILRGHH